MKQFCVLKNHFLTWGQART